VQETKGAIKFVRALLTNFLITIFLIWKIDKSMMNIIRIAKMLIVTLANFGFWELDARVELILSTDEG
jgi:hypothetical protein